MCIIAANATATEIQSCPTPVCEATALTWGVMRWDQVMDGVKLNSKLNAFFYPLVNIVFVNAEL